MSDKIVNVQPLHSRDLVITGRYCYGEKTTALAAEYGIHPRSVTRIFNKNSYALSSAKQAAEKFYSDRAAGSQSLHLCKFLMKA